MSTQLFAVAEPITLERLHYEENVSLIKKIKIINKFGDIRIRKSDQDEFIFHGVSQFSTTYQAKLNTKQLDDQLLVTVVYPKLPVNDSLVRVDVALIVPNYIELDIEIEKGHLSSKKIKNIIKARSKNSNMSIKSSNAVDLYTHNGDISFTLVNHKIPQSIKLQTQKGDIDLNYHINQTPSVQIISGGSTTSNSVAMLNNKKKDKRITNYNDSNSFDRVEIQSDTGSIQLIEIEQL